ncbi:MAG TPA: TolC family protein [Polyangiaceae bacterium]|nr:TolC family protein [Polyangiaceae bacterium]
MPRQHCNPTPQTPTSARTFQSRPQIAIWFRLALAWACLVTPARGQELTEAEIKRHVRRTSPEVLAAQSEVRLLQAREAVEAHPNPELSFTREQLLGAPDAAEDTLALSIPLDLSGRRGARSSLARAGSRSAASRATRLGSAVTHSALRIFYRGLAAKKRADLARTLVARLEEAARVSKSRLSQGSASGYDVSRIELDADLSRSTLVSAEAAERRAVLQLASLLGRQAVGLRLSGSLRAVAIVGSPPQERPSLTHQRAALEAARQAQSRAARAWVPMLALDAGVRRAVGDETRYGYVAGLHVELPLFSRGRAVSAEANALADHSGAQLRALEARAKSARAVASLELSNYLAEVERFRRATAPHAERTLRAARSAYREGQIGVTELLDAERAALRVSQRSVELELRAKLAELDLRAARGEFE